MGADSNDAVHGGYLSAGECLKNAFCELYPEEHNMKNLSPICKAYPKGYAVSCFQGISCIYGISCP